MRQYICDAFDKKESTCCSHVLFIFIHYTAHAHLRTIFVLIFLYLCKKRENLYAICTEEKNCKPENESFITNFNKIQIQPKDVNNSIIFCIVCFKG